MDHQTTATITVEEAGRLLGFSRSAAYRAVAARQIPALRIGRRLLVPVRALEALLAAPVDPDAPS